MKVWRHCSIPLRARWHPSAFSQLRLQSAVARDAKSFDHQMLEATTLEEAQRIWKELEQAKVQPSVDLMNSYLGKKVIRSIHLKRLQDLDPHFRFVERLKEKGVQPNLSTYTLLAQMVREFDPDNATKVAVLVDGVNELCRYLMESIKDAPTAAGKPSEGLLLLGTCTSWLQKNTDTHCLQLATYEKAFKVLRRQLTWRHMVGLLEVCKGQYDVRDARNKPLYLELYVSVAHNLFAANKYKALVKLFFEMHNLRIGPLPPTLQYCALHLCSALQPPKTKALFDWFASSQSQPDAHMYKYLLESYSQVGEVEAMMDAFQAMEAQGVQPTVSVYEAMMATLKKRAHPGDPRRLLGVYQAMRDSCGDSPRDYAPYELALWATRHLQPEDVREDHVPKRLKRRRGKAKAVVPQEVKEEQAKLREQILNDAKQDGHYMFWFLKS